MMFRFFELVIILLASGGRVWFSCICSSVRLDIYSAMDAGFYIPLFNY